MSVIVTDEEYQEESMRFIVRHDGVYPTPWRVRDTRTRAIMASLAKKEDADQRAAELNAEVEASPTWFWPRLVQHIRAAEAEREQARQLKRVPVWEDVRLSRRTAGGRQS